MSCQNGLLQNHLFGERIIHVICNVFRKLLGQVCTGKMKTNPYVLVIQMFISGDYGEAKFCANGNHLPLI